MQRKVNKKSHVAYRVAVSLIQPVVKPVVQPVHNRLYRVNKHPTGNSARSYYGPLIGSHVYSLSSVDNSIHLESPSPSFADCRPFKMSFFRTIVQHWTRFQPS